WHLKNNQISASLSNSNFNPRSNSLEPSVFNTKGDGNWGSATRGLKQSLLWVMNPWEIVSSDILARQDVNLSKRVIGRSEKVYPDDKVVNVSVSCGSSTNIDHLSASSVDLIITDPPFGSLLQY